MLSDMSIDYYSRLEQPRGPHPCEQILGALPRGLRLSIWSSTPRNPAASHEKLEVLTVIGGQHLDEAPTADLGD